MKYVAILVLLLGFTTPVHAEEGTADGKGIYCPTAPIFVGWWFEQGGVIGFKIEKLEVYISKVPLDYQETKASELNWFNGSTKKLDRQTLILNDGFTTCQCYLINSPEELRQTIQNQIDRAKAENKL